MRQLCFINDIMRAGCGKEIEFHIVSGALKGKGYRVLETEKQITKINMFLTNSSSCFY